MINEHGWKGKEKQELAIDKQGKARIEFFTLTNNFPGSKRLPEIPLRKN